MKNFLRILLIVVCLSCDIFTLKASHIAALDLGITNISGNDYMITFVLYRDCTGVQAPTAVSLNVQCTSNPAMNFIATASPIAGTGQEITVSCSSIPTNCNGGTIYGIQEFIYQAQVTLPACNEWVVFYTTCCRNPSNTISNPTSASAYIEARLNTQLAPGASTPILTGFPDLILCSNAMNCQNPGAVDIDGDSIAYELVTPFDYNNSSYVSWIPPSTATQPLPSSPPITLNPRTGELCISPNMNIVSPMAIRFQKWKKIGGVPTLIGTTYRDFQVNSISCNSSIPELSGIDTTLTNGFNYYDTIFYQEICPGNPVQFAIWGHDADTFNPSNLGNPEQFSIFWNQGIQGATLTPIYQSTDSAHAIFSWTPTPLHVGPTHCFVATIRDKSCPYYLDRQYTYCFKVKPGLSANIGPDVSLCSGSTHLFQATGDSSTATYQWFVDGNPMGIPSANSSYLLNTSFITPGTHIVSVLTNTLVPGQICPGIDFATIDIITSPDPYLGADTMLGFWDVLPLNVGIYDQYLWSTGDTSQIIMVDSSGHLGGYKSIWVQVSDSVGCIGSDTIILQFVANPGMDKLQTNPEVAVHPNPSDGHFNIVLSHFAFKTVLLEIVDQNGKLIQCEQITPTSEKQTHRINAGDLPDGLYLLKLTPEGLPPITQKIIIQ